MKLHSNLDRSIVAGRLCVVLCFALGLFLLTGNFWLAKVLVRTSYDRIHDLAASSAPNIQTSTVMVVYLDEQSHQDLKQDFDRPWDRALHAKLIDRLTADGARAIIFDILFTDPGTNSAANIALADAITRSGRVILAAERPPLSESAGGHLVTRSGAVIEPYEPFREGAGGVGLAHLTPHEDFLIREHNYGSLNPDYPSLSWAAAEKMGLPVTTWPRTRNQERWIYYYGPPETIPHVSYSSVNDLHSGYFRDKIVFVGARPMAGFFGERRDELRSPYFTWDNEFVFMPAVEVQATMLLNLVREDWLKRLPPAAEIAILFLVSVVSGLGLFRLRPAAAAIAALVGVVCILLLAGFCFAAHRLWFPWLIPVLVQIPLALAWAALFRTIEWYKQKRAMEEERKRAELRIREQAALLDKARDAIILHDLDWRVTYWNKSAERLYGWSAEEVFQKDLKDLLFAKEMLKLMEGRKLVLESGEWSGEFRLPTKTSGEVIVESRWTLVRDEGMQAQSILTINTDITEKKKLESQFLRAQRMESIGTLAGGIAHDLNNVLTPITMGVELLRMGNLDEPSKKFLRTIETSAKRGSDLVKQVLTFARGHEGERVVLQLNHLIKEMEKIVKETFPKNIQVKTRVAAGPPLINGDGTQLHQILLNLCVNARDAMPDGGEILIEATVRALDPDHARRIVGGKAGEYVALSVTDTGTGIPPEIMDRIFEPFFTTKEVGKGTGLGLSTVVSIAKGHGGFLEVKSLVGKGTTFSIYIPKAEATTTSMTTEKTRELPKGQGQRVLVVDDEAAIRDTAKAALAGFNYRVLTAMHGSEAVALCAQETEEIAVAVVDMLMPVMDGAATIRTLKKLKPKMRFIAISGLLQPDKIKEQLKAEEVVLLPKPFTAEKLAEVVHQALTAPPKPDETSPSPPVPASLPARSPHAPTNKLAA